MFRLTFTFFSEEADYWYVVVNISVVIGSTSAATGSSMKPQITSDANVHAVFES